MDEKKIKNRDMIFRIVVFVATYNGIQAFRGFFDIKTSVGSVDDYTMLVLVASLALNFLGFLFLSVAAFVMNFVARKAISTQKLIARSVLLGISTVMIWLSTPSISYIMVMGASKYPDIMAAYPFELDYIASYISGNIWTVFTYMIAAVLFAGLALVSIVMMIQNHRKRPY